MVAESVKACGIDMTRMMYSNIVIAGGTSMAAGLRLCGDGVCDGV